MNQLKIAAAALLACGLVACSSSNSEENAAKVNEAIVNGTALTTADVNFYGLVAVYHPDGDGLTTWFPRPCGGTILSSINGISTVLTARHCVTTNNDIDGVVAPASSFRLLPTATPGPANPNPPAGTVTPTQVLAPVFNSASPASEQDLALLVVSADWSTHVLARGGIWLAGPANAYHGVDYALGYGINTPDWNCYTDRSIVGAGVARMGLGFTDTSLVSTDASRIWQYSFTQPNGGSQAVICGDSGGPDFVDMYFDDDVFDTTLVGVHSTGSTTAGGSAGMSLWLQQALGGLPLGMHNGVKHNLYRALNSHTVSVSSTNYTRWLYDYVTHTVYDPSQEDVDEDWCLDANGSSNVVANLCSGAASQKWYPTTNLQLRNASLTGKCLSLPSSGTTPKVVTCSDSPGTQAWQFHAQP